MAQRSGPRTQHCRSRRDLIATGVCPNTTEHGWDKDEWPQISEKVMARCRSDFSNSAYR